MKFSFGKTIWKILSGISSIALWLFLIFDLAILIRILFQESFDWNQFFATLTVLILTFSLATVVGFLPPRVQFIYFILVLPFYYKFGYQILYSLRIGVNYDFLWSLPSAVGGLVGFSGQGKVIDFIFWSGLIFILLFFTLQLEHWILGFLAGKRVAFATEIWEGEKAKLIGEKRKLLEAQAGIKPLSGRQKALKFIWVTAALFLLSGLVILAILLWQKWENAKYPILWQESFPGTAVCLWECPEYGGKGALLPENVEPGKSSTANFSLPGKGEELILEVRLGTQPSIKPEASVEIELRDPDGQRILNVGREELIVGKPASSSLRASYFSKRFNFTVDQEGAYSLKITPYSYGILPLQVRVRSRAK